MYTKLKINIPIECTVSDTLGHNTLQVFASDPLQSSCYAGSQDQAKRKLRPAIEKEIKEALITTKNCSARAIGCKDGTVLVCMYRLGAWGYHIVGDGRKYASTSMGGDSLDAVTEQARRHAAQGFGGVAWESSL